MIIDIDDIRLRHINAIRNTATGKVLEQALQEIERLREHQKTLVHELGDTQDENERLHSALQAIIDRDPSRPGPKAAVRVNYQTAVAIAKQGLAAMAGGDS